MKVVILVLATVVTAQIAAGATFTVANTADSGPGSLRQAILDANVDAGLDTIAFNIPGAGVHTITPTTPLDSITNPVIIDGYTQPGSAENTDGLGTNAILLIELDGSATTNAFGLNINAAGASTIQGLVINHWLTGINLSGTGGHVVRGNFLGTDPTGTSARPNNVGVESGAANNRIGGTGLGDRNLVSGNTAGNFSGAVLINGLATNSSVQGNLIGTDATGLHSVPNFGGLAAYGTGNIIGGTAAGAGNVVSGNGLYGMWIEGSIAVFGNRIGTTADGAGPLGNGTDGINIHESSNSSIGGVLAGQANEIAYNLGAGILASNSGISNSIRGNSIHDNGGLGIDLNGDGPSHNDPGDVDEGANHLQNFPILQSVTTGATTHVTGKFNTTPSTTYDLDFYANPACANFPRELQEGATYLDSSQVTTDGAGHLDLDVTLPVATEAGARIAVTATDPNGNTSEFSQRIVFQMTGSRSGPASGGSGIGVTGTDFADPTTMTVGGVSTAVTFGDDHTLNSISPALSPGTANDLIVTTPDGTTGTLVKAWVSDFLDVSGAQQFYSFVTTLVSNAITVGVGGGLYGVDRSTLRQQMAVFLLKAKHGLCYTPPPCIGTFADVPCPSTFADWIEELFAEGIAGGCGAGNFCPTNPVRRDQMAPFLLKSKLGSSYVPPPCTGIFPDVACPSLFADWIEELSAEQITGGCGGGNYCPSTPSTRGQMAVFVVKTFNLQ